MGALLGLMMIGMVFATLFVAGVVVVGILKLVFGILLLPLRLLMWLVLLPFLLLKLLIGAIAFVIVGPILAVLAVLAAVAVVVGVAVPLLPLLLIGALIWALVRSTQTAMVPR